MQPMAATDMPASSIARPDANAADDADHKTETPGPLPSSSLTLALVQLGKRGMSATVLTLLERTEALGSGWIEITGDGETCRLTPAGRTAVRRCLALRRSARAAANPSSDFAEPVGNDAATPATNCAESPLAWLRARRDANGQPMLSDAQFDAGERLRADLWRAQMTPRVTASWSGIPQSRSERRAPPGSGADMADSVVGARKRIEHAFKAVGKDHFDLLFDVCGHLKGLEQVERDAGLPRRAGKFLLQRALTALARHYGLLPPLDVDAAIRNRLRHWGSDDYRPNLDHWEQG